MNNKLIQDMLELQQGMLELIEIKDNQIKCMGELIEKLELKIEELVSLKVQHRRCMFMPSNN